MPTKSPPPSRRSWITPALTQDKYQELIDAIYSDRAEYSVEATVKYRDGRMGTIKTDIKVRSVSEVAE